MGVIFGYAVSGLTPPTNSLLDSHIWGNHWITGGTYGPEGGLVASFVIIIATVWLWRTKRIKLSAEMLELLNENQEQRADSEHQL